MDKLNSLFNYFKNRFKNRFLLSPIVKALDQNIHILCIADTHGTLNVENAEKLKELEYDACFLLGDVSHKDLQILEPLLDKNKTYGLLGNHDDFGLLEKMGISNAHLKSIHVNGVSIFGFEGSNRYKNGKYPMYTQEEAEELLKDAPVSDIFVSHDSSFEALATNPAHCGFKAISDYLYRHSVPLHIHGHLHDPQQYSLKNGTSCICIYKAAIIETNPIKVIQIF